MSLLWQLSSSYGKSDTVWVLRDIDLVLGLWYDHPELSTLFRSTRDKVIALLSQAPTTGVAIRNRFFEAKDEVVHDPIKNWHWLSQDNQTKLVWIDMVHWEYQRLMILRQMMLQNPKKTLIALSENIENVLRDFPLPKSWISSITENIAHVNESSFEDLLKKTKTELGQIGVISFCEWCIAEWKMLSQVIEYAEIERKKIEEQKQTSMEYWDLTNIINLARTRQKIDLQEIPMWSKSFILSGWAWNAFAQLAIMQKFVEDWWKIKSISGTSMGAAVAILVWSIGNDSQKIKELMQDLIVANNNGEIPRNLVKNEYKMISVFEWLREKYGIGHGTRFSDLQIPIVVNVWRQYQWWEQEVVLGWNENIVPSVLASMNVPFPHKNNNIWALGKTPIHLVNLIDYAANERWNPTHWIELLWEKQENLIVIDVGYSSENGWSPLVRRIFQRATIRDFLAKLRILNTWGKVIDVPLSSHEGYVFPDGAIERFFQIGQTEYDRVFPKN